MRGRATFVALFAVLASACQSPMLARDGTLVFQQPGARGAAIVTANGLEFRDREDVPTRVVVQDARAPWRAPIGFIVPRDGRFTKTSLPTLVATTGLAVVLRPSDTRVPSWGGEVLVRIDVIAPAAEGTARAGESIAVVLDGEGEDVQPLVDVLLGQLAARDRLSIVDAAGSRIVVPSIPGSHRDLASAAVAKRLSLGLARRGPRGISSALRLAEAEVRRGEGTSRVVVLSDGHDADALAPLVSSQLATMAGDGIRVSGIGASATADSNAVAAIGMAGAGVVGTDVALDARTAAARTAVPPAGDLAFRDVSLTFAGVPAPSHVLEASGGDAVWRLDAGELLLGEIHAGEARTDVVRVSVPAWVPGEPFTFTVTARWRDARTHQSRSMGVALPCRYDDDIERIARSRHGDVIAYASALATLRRLDAAFVGEGVVRAGGLRATGELHARSMQMLATQTGDFAMLEQARVLAAVLAAAATDE